MRSFLRTALVAILFLNPFVNTTQIVQAGLLPPSYALGAGWATFGVVLPKGFSSSGLKLGNLFTQTDVKTRWNDGSIRFAVITANVPSSGVYTLATGGLDAGTFVPISPTASVVFTIGGIAYTATLPSSPSADRWLTGSQVTEWRHVVMPQATDGAPQGFLSVIFDVRAYSNGVSRVDVTVENPYDKIGGTKFTYDVQVTVNGQQRFQKLNVIHYYLARWRKVFPIGLNESDITPDFEPTLEAKALPRYMATVPLIDLPMNGPTFEILQRGGLSYNQMDQAGGRPEIGPYPDWTITYFIHRLSSQRAYILANGDLAGSQPVHIRETDGTLVSIDKRPQFWLDERGKQFTPENDKPKGDLLSTYGSADPLYADMAHQPSLAYVPYLLTGDRYYKDEMAFWCNYNLLSSQPFYFRQNEKGILAGASVRAFGWSLRNLVDGTAYLPDSDSNKAYFVNKIMNNLQWSDDYADGKVTTWDWKPPSNALGTSFEFVNENQPGWEGLVTMSQWQQNFLAFALWRAIDQGFASQSKLRDRIVKFQLKMFTSDPDFPRENAAPYYPALGTLVGPDKTWRMYQTMAEFYQGNLAAGQRNPGFSFPSPFDYYGRDARLSLLAAVKLGFSGAANALAYLESTNFPNQPAFMIASDAPAPATFQAVIVASALNGKPPLTINFNGFGIGGGSIKSYAWNFGDNGTAGIANPSHVFTANGSYTVTLTLTDVNNAVATTQKRILVSDQAALPPTVSFLSPRAGDTVQGKILLSASATGGKPIAQVQFFVDGQSVGTAMQSPFGLAWNSGSASDGPHTLSATATDSDGVVASASVSVDVQNAVGAAPTNEFQISPSVCSRKKGCNEVVFENLPSDASVKIYTARGLLVKDLQGASWDLENSSGHEVVSGVYNVVIKSSSLHLQRKIAILR